MVRNKSQGQESPTDNRRGAQGDKMNNDNRTGREGLQEDEQQRDNNGKTGKGLGRKGSPSKTNKH